MKKREAFEIQFNAFKWIENNLNYFSLYNAAIIDRNRIKAFVELVFLVNFLEDSSKKNLSKIKRFIEFEINNFDFESALIHDIDALAGIAVIEEYCINNGISKYNALLNKVVDNKIDIMLQKTPFRILDLSYSLSKAGIKSNLGSNYSLYKKTFLGKNKNLCYVSPMGAYSITHTIFYLTDMGRSLMEDSIDINKINSKLVNLMAYYLFINDMDITSELIMCKFFIKNVWNQKEINLLNEIIEKIKELQAKDGRVPPPKYRREFNKEMEFFQCYHTTLVVIGATECIVNK